MIRSVIIAFSALAVLMSCAKDDATRLNSSNNGMPFPDDTTARRSLLALGDSYTIGQSVSVAERYPVQTVKQLNEAGIKFNDPEIIAQTGWTTGNLLAAIAQRPPSKDSFDIVTLLIGVNNQYQRRTLEEYKEQFTTLLNLAIRYAGNNKRHVVVLSIPDYSVTPFASGSNRAQIAEEIDNFNAANKAISETMGVNWLDITELSRVAATDPTLIAADGLHPSGIEYWIWSNGLVPAIQHALK